MSRPNAEIVALLKDCENFGADAWESGALRHRDGSPFTEAEHQMVGQATRTELLAMLQQGALDRLRRTQPNRLL